MRTISHVAQANGTATEPFTPRAQPSHGPWYLPTTLLTFIVLQGFALLPREASADITYAFDNYPSLQGPIPFVEGEKDRVRRHIGRDSESRYSNWAAFHFANSFDERYCYKAPITSRGR